MLISRRMLSRTLLVKCSFLMFMGLSLYFIGRMGFFSLVIVKRGLVAENSTEAAKVVNYVSTLKLTNTVQRLISSVKATNKKEEILVMSSTKEKSTKRVTSNLTIKKPVTVTIRKPASKIRSLTRLHSATTWPMMATKTRTKSPHKRNRMPITRPTRSIKDIYGEGCKNHHVQKGFPTLIEFWVQLAARQNITDYFICFGSLLGAWLHGQAVPYDHDIDICILRKDLPKLDPEEAKRPFDYADGKPHLIIQRSSPHPNSKTPRQDCHGNKVSRRTDPCAILDPHARVLLGSLPFLDVFVLADNKATLYDEYERMTYTRDVILPTKPCKFLGFTTRCPNKVPEYLTKFFGKDYMKPHKVCRNGTWIRNKS